MRIPKKLINDPSKVAKEQLEGLIAANHGRIQAIGDKGAVCVNPLPSPQVAIVTGGGSGHEPMFAGYLGPGLATAAACGDIFAAPPPGVILDAAQAADQGKGVLFVYGNYAGDNMNFDIAAELADDEDIETQTIRIWDDVASAPLSKIKERRGVAGDLFVLKIAGAAAAQGKSLGQVTEITAHARDCTRSVGVALSAGSIPQTGKYNFELPDDELEYGMGLHGEPGVSREKMASADTVVEQLLDRIIEDLPFVAGDKVCLLINNLGSSTVMELLIANRKVHSYLESKNIEVHDTLIGSYCTSQEMAGYSISLLKLDDTLTPLYDAPCHSFALRK
ncbi:dihydroxyacetone kinase subunit DhaK [Alginatibacterium sediminis]|uniref:Dihydroxyacetone kinase subunit DhaK n=1 Tax=Alginatibacterium sediminis TaxID=2164068 RepID=A0A420EI02_9ALTE|nr:dihydroxyacetone kinase subunit DhaK [Alginatibacterium sediminis]RKF20290.1 dihydroxyacetone kinase subunit DhaK [Alginatibacterium sediminis]